MAEIVVIGAGIAGLATAGALQRRGHSVTVIEERTDTGSGAGISIWPNALAALDALGLGDLGLQAQPYRVGGQGQRVGADTSVVAQPAQERQQPLGVLERHLGEQCALAVTAGGFVLVERVRGEAGDGGQEQLASCVVGETRCALMGEGVGALGGQDADGALGLAVRSIEAAHGVPFC